MMMRCWFARLGLLIAGLTSAVAFAQHGGGRSGAPPGGGRPSPQQSAEEATQAATAKQWADVIDKVRASSPPPPLPQIRWPSENEKLLSRLRYAPDPRLELTQYLDKLWKDAKEPSPRRAVMEGLWRDAEKPKWVRAAIEAYYRQHANGLQLRPEEPSDAAKTTAPASPASAEAKREGADKPKPLAP
jgi:hypothetical protein